jgi:hypothetical protein
MNKVVHHVQIQHFAKFEYIWTLGRQRIWITKFGSDWNKWKTVWNCELGPAQCYSPDPLKPTASSARSDRASVTIAPPPSGRSYRTAPCHLPSQPPRTGHAPPPSRAPPLSPLILIRCEHRQGGKARLIFPTRNSSVASAFPRRLPLLQRRALPRQPPPVGQRQGNLLERRLNLDLLPELLVVARSWPQATLRRRFFRQEHLSMDRLVRSSSDPYRHHYKLRPCAATLIDPSIVADARSYGPSPAPPLPQLCTVVAPHLWWALLSDSLLGSSLPHRLTLGHRSAPPGRRLAKILAGVATRRHGISLPCFSNGPPAQAAGLAQNGPASDGHMNSRPRLFSVYLVWIKFE